MLVNPHGTSPVLDHATGVHDNLLTDDYYGEEAISNHLKACGTPKGNQHAAGIQIIVDPTLVPVLEYVYFYFFDSMKISLTFYIQMRSGNRRSQSQVSSVATTQKNWKKNGIHAWKSTTTIQISVHLTISPIQT